MAVGLAIAIATIAFFSYASTQYWNIARHLVERYYEVFSLGVENPDFMDARKTRRYEEAWVDDDPRVRNKYEAYARLCWSHARDIYSAKFLVVFFRRRFKRQYANAFETYRRLHGRWLKDNHTLFSDRRFQSFITKCKWRNYVDPHTADLLRWNNEEVDRYSETFGPPIDSFLRVPTNRLLDYLNQHYQTARTDTGPQTVADFGCVIGRLLPELAARFDTVYAVDTSENRLNLARERYPCERNIKFHQTDLRDLTELRETCDVICSVNSILPRNPSDRRLMLRQVAQTLKSDGRFVAVLPAFDALVQVKKFERKRFVQRRQEQRTQVRQFLPGFVLGRFDAWKLFNWDQRMSGLVDTTLGRVRLLRWFVLRVFRMLIAPNLFADDGGNVQTFFTKEEIPALLDQAGLEVEGKIGRVEYTWKDATAHGYGHLRAKEYDSKNPIFDWFVVGKLKR